jgi:hypothetical protein
MATQTITFKRASTFYASVTYTPDSGGAPTLDGVTITSDVRDAHGKIYACAVTLTSPTTFSVSYDATAAWSLGSAYWDIRFANNGVVFFSDTAVLNIVDNITVS